MSTGPDLVTLGESMVLLLSASDRPLRRATTFERSLAGAESNVAIGVARLGHDVRWIGRVGADAFGDVVRDTLRAEGVEVALHVDPDAPTGVLVRDRHAERPIEVLYHRRDSAGSRLRPDDVAGAVGGARILHLTGITPLLSATAAAAVEAALTQARSSGATVTFDPNVRLRLAGPAEAAATLGPLARRCDVVLAGVEEAMLLSGCDDDRAAAEWFLEGEPRLVVIKDGSRGVWATDGDRAWTQPAFAVTAADPVGAGDAFAAGFIAATLRGLGTGEALTLGAATAASVVQVAGDIDGLPTEHEVQGLLRGEHEARR
ncbi:MAG: sugar kinase [Nitriliruptoraceae bacterium]|nr:sugar kinase [Nitriliruptoraceae bacterium]